MKRIEAKTTPTLLVWARETAGLSIDGAALKVKVKQESILAWEKGMLRPSIPQLRKLALAYKRPLAAFYLPEPPIRYQVMHDFRHLNDSELWELGSPTLAFEIRRAFDRREWALEMLESIEESPPVFRASAAITEDIEVVAKRLRKALGISVRKQSQWRDAADAFRNWRMVFEDAGILVFQATTIKLEEARGLSISMAPLPVVVSNIKDSPRGRIFTLLHEAAHVMLNQGGVCDFGDATTESFCNRVAGAALFPREALLGTDVVRNHPHDDPMWSDVELMNISRIFGGSREAALVRLLTLGRTSKAYYNRIRKKFVMQYEEEERRKRARAGFVPPHVIALASAGSFFTNLVIENYNRENISVSDVSDFLQVRVKHVRDIRGEYSGMSRN